MTKALELSRARSFDGLWPDEAARRRQLRRYGAMNASFDPPLVVDLSRRGFFGEVNIVIIAALFALEKRKRLAVSGQSFNGLWWADYFASELPLASPELVKSTPFPERISKPKLGGVGRLLIWLRGAVRGGAEFRFAALEIQGGVFEAQRSLFQMLCRPTPAIEAAAAAAMAELGLDPGQFAAVYLRRGDAPAGRITEILRELSPSTRDVFVLTDDLAVVGELQATCPDRRVVTLCPPQATGHDPAAFDAETAEAGGKSVRRRLVECLIAARSDAFAGGFKSSLAKFIASIHVDPDRCFSTDAQAALWPFR